MVAKRSKNRLESPDVNVRVELDNEALKTKNINLTQTVAKLQQEKSELIQQLNLLRRENFEVIAKYNYLKNVVTKIHSMAKKCLPRFNEIFETLTGIFQICSVVGNISNFLNYIDPVEKDTRTQAVTPQIVNGHILQNPTINLTRLNNEPDSPNTNTPSTSRELHDNSNRDRVSNGVEEQTDEESNNNINEVEEVSFVCKANRQLPTTQSLDVSRRLAGEYEDSDEENEEPVEEEESDQGRLTTVHEMEEDEYFESNSTSPKESHIRFLHGKVQEVRIYLNQLPDEYVNRCLDSNKIRISITPPDRRTSVGRRSSFGQSSSSLIGLANESVMNDSRLDLKDHLNRSKTSRRKSSTFRNDFTLNQESLSDASSRNGKRAFEDSVAGSSTMIDEMSQGDTTVCGNSIHNGVTPVSTRSKRVTFGDSCTGSSTMLDEFSENVSAIEGPHLSSTDSLHESTPLPRLSLDRYGPSGSKSNKLESNITKRKRGRENTGSNLLRRVSRGDKKRQSGSPIKLIEGIVNLPVIRKSTEIVDRQKARSPEKKLTKTKEKSVKKGKRVEKPKKKDSPIKKISGIESKSTVSPKNSSRPTRAARPKVLKEANLHKKLRRN